MLLQFREKNPPATICFKAIIWLVICQMEFFYPLNKIMLDMTKTNTHTKFRTSIKHATCQILRKTIQLKEQLFENGSQSHLSKISILGLQLLVSSNDY